MKKILKKIKYWYIRNFDSSAFKIKFAEEPVFELGERLVINGKADYLYLGNSMVLYNTPNGLIDTFSATTVTTEIYESSFNVDYLIEVLEELYNSKPERELIAYSGCKTYGTVQIGLGCCHDPDCTTCAMFWKSLEEEF